MSDGLTYNLIEKHELFYTRSDQQGDWLHIDTDSSYDDGYEYFTYVFCEVSTSRYYAFDYRTNSWDTEPLSQQELNIREVFPREVTVTQYFAAGE